MLLSLAIPALALYALNEVYLKTDAELNANKKKKRKVKFLWIEAHEKTWRVAFRHAWEVYGVAAAVVFIAVLVFSVHTNIRTTNMNRDLCAYWDNQIVPIIVEAPPEEDYVVVSFTSHGDIKEYNANLKRLEDANKVPVWGWMYANPSDRLKYVRTTGLVQYPEYPHD